MPVSRRRSRQQRRETHCGVSRVQPSYTVKLCTQPVGGGKRGQSPDPTEGCCSTWPWRVPQVRQLQEGAAQLRTVYAGEHAEAIASREQEVMQGWKELLAACEDARLHVSSTADALRFHSQARDLLSWMDGIAGQIGAADKPRCSLSHLRLPACLWAATPCSSAVLFP